MVVTAGGTREPIDPVRYITNRSSGKQGYALAQAALDAGASAFMNAFNDLNGVPANGSRYLQRDILKGEWGFSGVVVSDWGSIGEMVRHGYVADDKGAAPRLALVRCRP